MQPLLKIQTIPIKIEAQTKRASLQQSTEPTPAPRRPIPAAPRPVPAPQQRQVRPDPQPQPEPRVTGQSRNTQRAAAPDNAGSYLQEASNAVQAYNHNVTVGGAAVSGASAAQPVDVEYVPPAAPADVPEQVAAPTSFDYTMDRDTFDWNSNAKPQLEYVPASIEYSVSQYPQVVIEYVGEPIYVPASSNPNYVPPPETKGKA